MSDEEKKEWELHAKFFCPLSIDQEGDCVATCAWFIEEKQKCAVKILALIMAKEELGLEQKQ